MELLKFAFKTSFVLLWSQPILIECSHHLQPPPPPVFLDVCFPKITEFEIICITVFFFFLTNSASLVFISSTPHIQSGLEVQ